MVFPQRGEKLRGGGGGQEILRSIVLCFVVIAQHAIDGEQQLRRLVVKGELMGLFRGCERLNGEARDGDRREDDAWVRVCGGGRNSDLGKRVVGRPFDKRIRRLDHRFLVCNVLHEGVVAVAFEWEVAEHVFEVGDEHGFVGVGLSDVLLFYWG